MTGPPGVRDCELVYVCVRVERLMMRWARCCCPLLETERFSRDTIATSFAPRMG